MGWKNVLGRQARLVQGRWELGTRGAYHLGFLGVARSKPTSCAFWRIMEDTNVKLLKRLGRLEKKYERRTLEKVLLTCSHQNYPESAFVTLSEVGQGPGLRPDTERDDTPIVEALEAFTEEVYPREALRSLINTIPPAFPLEF